MRRSTPERDVGRRRSRRRRRRVYDKPFEEDAVEENGNFRPVESVHFQIGDGIGYQDRPFHDVHEMNGTLWANWQLGVDADDTLVCVGDFALGEALSDETWDRVRAAPGRSKILVVGNHDITGQGHLRVEGFHRTKALLVSPGDPPLIWTHVPMPNVPPRHVNIHGHTHRSLKPADSPHINVSVEQLDYRPVELSRLRRLAQCAGRRPRLRQGETTLERIEGNLRSDGSQQGVVPSVGPAASAAFMAVHGVVISGRGVQIAPRQPVASREEKETLAMQTFILAGRGPGGSAMSDRTPGRDTDLAGAKAAMKRAAKAAREREAEADMDYEEIRADLEGRPSNVVYSGRLAAGGRACQSTSHPRRRSLRTPTTSEHRGLPGRRAQPRPAHRSAGLSRHADARVGNLFEHPGQSDAR